MAELRWVGSSERGGVGRHLSAPIEEAAGLAREDAVGVPPLALFCQGGQSLDVGHEAGRLLVQHTILTHVNQYHEDRWIRRVSSDELETPEGRGLRILKTEPNPKSQANSYHLR